MTRFDRINSLNIDEMAEFFAEYLPPNICYICPYDDGLNCLDKIVCTNEYIAGLYKKWLEEKVEGEADVEARCEHVWEYNEHYDPKNMVYIRQCRCCKCGKTETEEVYAQ